MVAPGVTKSEAKAIARHEVKEHERQWHDGPHVTIVTHAPNRHVVHNDHTGMSSEHTDVRKARAAAREMRNGR